MGEFITTTKMRELLADIPENERDGAIQFLVDRGHEIEGLNAEFSPIEAVKNIPASLGEFGKNIWSAVTSPVQTVKALSSVAKGGFKVAYENITGEQVEGEDDEKAFRGMVDFFAERYGSMDRLLNTIERDPVGFLSDASNVLGGAGGTLKAVGAVSKLSRVQQVGGALAKISRVAEPTAVLGKTVKTVTKPARAATTRFIKATGADKTIAAAADRLAADAIGLAKKQGSKISSSARISENSAAFLTKHGIYGSLEFMYGQLDHIKNATYAKVDELLGSLDGTYKPRDAKVILQQIRGGLTDEFKDVSAPSGAQAFSVAKESLSTGLVDDLNEINALLVKFDGEGLTLSELNRVKRFSDDYNNLFTTAGDVRKGVKAKNLADARERVKSVIEQQAARQGVRNIRELNQQTSLSHALREVVADRIQEVRHRRPWIDKVSGTIMLTGGTGSAITGSFAPLVLGGLGVGVAEIMRLPSVRSYWGTRLRLMAEGDFKALQGAIETEKYSSKATKIIQRERRYFSKAYPELRLGGIAQQKAEEARK